MSNVGALTVSAMRGTLQGPRPIVRVFQRPGVVGHGLVVSAAHGVEQDIETDLISSRSACLAHLDAAEALVGTVVSITDADGSTFANCSILNCQGQTMAIAGAGAGVDCLVRVRWSIKVES